MSFNTPNKKSSPSVTVKRSPVAKFNWQDYIDREQSSVDQLMEESFAEFLKRNNDQRQFGSLTRNKYKSPDLRLTSASSSSTMPRKRVAAASAETEQQQQHIPPGIQELESLYAPMKNLMQPLPGNKGQEMMPELHPLHTLPGNPLFISEEEPKVMRKTSQTSSSSHENDDQESVIFVPPPLKPVQSHAMLERSLGHEIPRTPLRTPKSYPPMPPPRLSTTAAARPHQLNFHHHNRHHHKEKDHRSSLMSTGSSENSSDSSLPSTSSTTLPVTPVSPNGGSFAWANYSINNDQDHSAPSSVCSSPVYVKMNPNVFNNKGTPTKESHYMNVLYNAVQQQGGSGSVESAYMAMNNVRNNVKTARNAEVEVVSAIYAQPQVMTSTPNNNNPPRQRSNSASRLQEVISRRSRRKSSSSKSKAAAEFKELMREVDRKRHFRVGLNIFNSQPELGVEYLVQKDFLELSPSSVAKFLVTNPGLSKEKVGEYLGNLQSPFCMKVLSCFMDEMAFAGLRLDKALRHLLQYVRVPGEAQKVERVMEEFGRRFIRCNPPKRGVPAVESVVTLAFAAMLLNTDLHSPSLKPDKKMTSTDFIQNLRGVDGGRDFDTKLLKSIYKGIKKKEFSSGADHVLQTQIIQRSLVSSSSIKSPLLAEHHRRLVCLCRLYEVTDLNSRKETDAVSHPRDIFLFNDLLVVTKAVNQQHGGSFNQDQEEPQQQYGYRDSFHLTGLEVTLFHTPVFHYGIQIGNKGDAAAEQVLLTLNAGSEHDRYKFVMDLQESIFEMDLMNRVLNEISSSSS